MPQLDEAALRAALEQFGGLHTLDSLGDQRAKDLIDSTDNERDPRRAIRLLHRALRYGRTSIQAAKAFQRLGMKYEDLGNARLAIKYYSEGIALDDGLGIAPIPTLYWRGRLLHQRGDVAAAREDFARALALDSNPSWDPDEREFAERVLSSPEGAE
jgi:tetratricopeptide (TPR) repeat protein